jgi:cysteine desulfurase
MKRGKDRFIYLDHNATTPIDPGAVNAMLSVMEQEFGNPSSPYFIGVRAKDKIEEAREEVGSLLGCTAEEITFTSGGSESNNAVLKGLIDFRNPRDFHIITTAVEHPAILNPVLYLAELGVDVTILPVDSSGRMDPDEIRRAIKPHTVLISIMLANNETGTLQPVKEISTIAKDHGIPLHTDAAQGVGKIPVDVNELGVDFLTVAGHKLYGPKGVGALFIRKGHHITPLIHGGGQERGRRAGTENIILCVGLGAACKIARGRLGEDFKKTKALRDRLQEMLFHELDGLVLNGHPVERLPNTLNISVPGIEGRKILEGLPNILASTGAACHESTVTLSHVLYAMGVPPEVGMGALRFTVGRSNTTEQIEEAGGSIIALVREMKRG